MILLKLFLFLILKGILADDNDTTRSGVQLWRAHGDFDEDVLNEFYDRARFTEEIWKRNNRTIDFLLFDDETKDVATFLDDHKITHKVLIDDVRQTVDDALLKTFPTRRNAVSGNTFTWTGYPSLKEINRYLKIMSQVHWANCLLITIGNSSQNKPINMLRISTSVNSNRPPNRAILVESGMHGREWTGVISTLYFIDSIVRNLTKQPDVIKKKDWYVIPVLNPDGYEYSLNKDPLWRKNRRKLSGCYGVDLNRNFDYNWGKQESYQIVCSLNYCGPAPFSEEESKALKRLTDGTHFYGYLSIHSAGTKVLFPFTSLGEHQENHEKHFHITREMAVAMRKVSNYQFTNGNIQIMGKNGYGMAIDWMYYAKGITHSYMIETRGQNGLDLIPSNQILVAAQEVREGIVKFAALLGLV